MTVACAFPGAAATDLGAEGRLEALVTEMVLLEFIVIVQGLPFVFKESHPVQPLVVTPEHPPPPFSKKYEALTGNDTVPLVVQVASVVEPTPLTIDTATILQPGADWLSKFSVTV